MPMGPNAPWPNLIVLDACCLLNLYATRRQEEIGAALPAVLAVAERAAIETHYLRRGGVGDDADEREPVDLTPLIAAGRLTVWRVETEAEAASYIDFAARLDDGEAMTCALAQHRGAAVATDDRKVARLMSSRSDAVPIITTTMLLRAWAEAAGIAPAELGDVLRDVRQRARFLPGRHDPLRSWWERNSSTP